MKTRDITHLLAIGTPYLLMLSTLYLFGYWSTFKINIFEFLEWPQIVMLSIQQLFILFLIIVPLIILTNLFKKLRIQDKRLDPDEEERLISESVSKIKKNWRSNKKKWDRNILIGLSILLTLFVASSYAFSSIPIDKFIASLLFGLMFGFFLAYTPLFSDIIKGRVRFFTLYVLGFTPFMVLSYGSWEAHIKTRPDNITKVFIDEQFYADYAYLGYAGSYFFLYNLEDNTILSVRENGIKTIRFIKEENQKGE